MLGFLRSKPPAVAARIEPSVTAAETSGVTNPAFWLTEIGWGGSGAQSRVKSLPHVSPVTAERHATVYACCNNITGDLAKVPLQVAAESVGLALAGQEAAARSASGGTTKAAILLRDDYEDDEARRRTAARIKGTLTDPTSGDFPVQNEGEDIKSLDLSAADQELLATRKFDREMIAAMYRMPPSKLQMLENGVKANGQQQALDYRSDCLMHWDKPVTQQYDQGLLTQGERERGLFFRHDFSVLLEPTTKELFDAMKVAVGGPWVTPNGAQRITKQPITDGGDKLYPPSNMTREEPPANEGDEE